MNRAQVREGRLSFLLLMLMLLCIVWSMEMAGWVEGLHVVEWTALGGLIVGFILTRSRLPRILSHLLSLLIGVLLIFWVMVGLIDSNLGWREGLSILAYHFDAWLRVAVTGESSYDTTMFVLLMTVLGWWLGYTSAWLVFGKHKVWQALALTGVAMLLVVYGSPSEIAPFFLLYVFCALLLAVRLYVYTQEQSWQSAKAHYDQDVQFYFLRDGGLLLVIVLLAVWVLPLLSSSSLLTDLWTQVEGPWHTIGDQWNRVFAGVRGRRGGYQNVPFADQLPLGGPVELGSDVVMWVEAEEGQYWRGTVYDRYSGHGWQNTDRLSAIVTPDKYLPHEGDHELRQFIRQKITPNWSGVGQLFGVGQPATVDLPVEVRYSFADAAAGDGRDPFSAPVMVSLISSRVPIGHDRPYTVISSASVADVESLRQAGKDYPTWVTGRYLQLPDTLPPRIGELAEEIVAPHDNEYDRAAALQDYLRRTIAYNENIEGPPPDRDGVDYLLFDSREGYCSYYASAMVVMARTVGIPSRLAVGYAGGDFDGETSRYEVRERDTHAWVEVYFPRYGWVEFEPTASESLILRPDAEDALRDELQELRAERPDSDRPFQRDLVLEGIDEPSLVTSSRVDWARAGWAAALVLIPASAVAGFWMFRMREQSGTSEVERSYRAMCTYGRLLGVTAQASHTPDEYGVLLAEEVPERALEIGSIAALYVQNRFSRPGIGLAEHEAAGKAWRRLRRTLWRKLPAKAVEIGRRVVGGVVRLRLPRLGPMRS